MSFSHIDNNGNIKMVDVGDKPDQKRTAIAEGVIKINPDVIKIIQDGNIKKGNVLTTAKIAGIMAAKKTSDLIPLCHNIILNSIDIEFKVNTDSIYIKSSVICYGKTGAEMEALTSVSIASLTIYDMCKAVDKNMQIGEIRLCEKTKV